MRTICAAGGAVLTPLDLYVAGRPPSTEHFLSQRARQAYDDFAMPARLGAFLAIGPLTLLLTLRAPRSLDRRRGRRLDRGRRARPPEGRRRRPLPGEWLAARPGLDRRARSLLLAGLGARLRGGARYGDGRLPLAATPMRRLRHRYLESGTKVSSGTDGGRPLSARKRVVL